MPHCTGNLHLPSLKSCLRCKPTLSKSHVSNASLPAEYILFRSAFWDTQRQQVWPLPPILIEALNGPEAFGSWHTVVNPLQAALAPFGRSPLLQKAVHAKHDGSADIPTSKEPLAGSSGCKKKM